MPLGGGGGNQKEDNPGEGEGGGSAPGSNGEAADMADPWQMPPFHKDAFAPERPFGKREKFLGPIFVGIEGWGAIGGDIWVGFLVFGFLLFVVLSFFHVFLFRGIGMISSYVCVLYCS